MVSDKIVSVLGAKVVLCVSGAMMYFLLCFYILLEAREF